MRATSQASVDEGTRYAQNQAQARNGRLLYAGLLMVLCYRTIIARMPPARWWDVAAMLAVAAVIWLVCSHLRGWPVLPGWIVRHHRPGAVVVDERISRERASLEAALATALFTVLCLDCIYRRCWQGQMLGEMWDLSAVFLTTLFVGAHRNMKLAPPTWASVRHRGPRMVAVVSVAIVLVALMDHRAFWPTVITGLLGGVSGLAVYMAVIWWKDREN